MLCKKCGSKISKDAKVCEKCGNPVAATSDKAGSDRKKWIYVGAAAGVLLILAFVILLSGKAGGDLLKTGRNGNNTSVDQTVPGDPAQAVDQANSGQAKKGKNKKSSNGNNSEPKEPEAPDNMATPEPTEEVILNYTDEYVFPYSDSKYLKKSDVKDLPPATISLGKDELYARYGRIFDDVEIQNHFDQCGWYTATYTEAEWNEFGDDYFFNKYEKKNLAFLEKWQKKMNQKSDKQ